MEKTNGEGLPSNLSENGERKDEALTEQQIIATYKGMLGEVSQLRRKIAELEQEMSEHQ